MTSSIRLGGFKVLDKMEGFSLILPKGEKNLPALLFKAAAQERINLTYFTLLNHNSTWGVNAVVESSQRKSMHGIIEGNLGNYFRQLHKIAILSIFPHKNNPEITGNLIDALAERDLTPYSLANSPSAISIILKEEFITKAGRALFKPFIFSSYRTPADWKLTQQGEKELHKEIIASYQEKKPKVYGLEYVEEQVLLKVILRNEGLRRFANAFKKFAQLDLNLIFSTTAPFKEGHELLAFCLPDVKIHSYMEIIKEIDPQTDMENYSPVTVFSMNGPHFGDRYGIVSEILSSFDEEKIDLQGLSCTIASITGAVPSLQTEAAIKAIQECFEVPAVFKK
jgi:aspartokinase